MGFQFYRAMYTVMMLLGAVEAVGGLRVDFTWNVHGNYKALDNVKIKDPPYDYTLKDSKFFPINTVNPGMISKVMLDPEKYEVDKVPEMAILYMHNATLAQTDQANTEDAYKQFKFLVAIAPGYPGRLTFLPMWSYPPPPWKSTRGPSAPVIRIPMPPSSGYR
jgi:anaerobic selenocysteine-containing dehydrogenase